MAASDVIKVSIPKEDGPYTVYRQDTHGNTEAIEKGVSEKFADALIARLEEHVHHQGYWKSIPPENTP